MIFYEWIYLFGLCGFILVTTLKLCQPLSINYYYFLMKSSIMISLSYLYAFIIYLIVIISSFSFATYVLLYRNVFSFRTLKATYLTLFRIFLLLEKFHQTFINHTSIRHLIFFVYTFFSAIILMNLCLSILNESFALIKKIQREIGSEYMFDWELNRHFWNQLLSFFRLKQNAETRKKGNFCM